ncbi:MAG: lipopolysaccharide heptosyltransferase I [Arenicella sp.]|nr:lipopolysaccharide heptosyltransferase I [Arenicella sp.]
MRVLVVKLTSMGDVLHLMPALSDLIKAKPDVVIDWMVEDSFAEIPAWYPSVDRVIKVSTRRWRSLKGQNFREFWLFVKELRSETYDVVIDAQGLIKSAGFARLAKLKKEGIRAGFSGSSIKESPAAMLYHKKVEVVRGQHAIERLRQLFAGVFAYGKPNAEPDYKLSLPKPAISNADTVMLFHGTTWATKHLPDSLWCEIADLACDDGYKVILAWGNEVERQRAELIATDRPDVMVLERTTLTYLARTIAGTSGAIAVDTGLGHMAAALGIPCVSVYGSTDSTLTGAVGPHQRLIQSRYSCSPCLLKQCPKLSETVLYPPCYKASEANPKLSAAAIWQTLYRQIV